MNSVNRSITTIILFILFTGVFTFPLSLKMNSAIPGYSNTDEPYAIISNMWLFKYCQENKIDLKKCDFISYPWGVDLKSTLGSSYLWESLKHLLVNLTNYIFTFNLLILLSFVLSGWLTYLLVYRITQSHPAALFSGFIFSFCPYHFARAWQHLALSQIQWIPLYILSLLNLEEKVSIKNILFTAFSLFLLASFNFYYAYFMAAITLLFIPFLTIKERKNLKPIFNFCLALALACLIVLILISPSLWEIYQGRKLISPATAIEDNLLRRPFENLFSQSARPLSYFLPAAVHPFFGGFTEQFIGSRLYGASFTEHTLYLGWVPLILALFAFVKLRNNKEASEKKRFYFGVFVFLAITAWFFSQPPWWNMGFFKIFMPSLFLYKIFPMFRAYSRFGIIVMLAISVLSGFGLKLILSRLKTQSSKLIITILFFGLVFLEFLNFPPAKVIDLNKPPEVYTWLRRQPGSFVIAEYPLDTESPNTLYLFYQTIHHKRMINATSPGTPANDVAKMMVKLSAVESPKMLKWMKVKYILVHKEDYKKTELVSETEELKKIPHNPLLKLVKSFGDDIDLYEIDTKDEINPLMR